MLHTWCFGSGPIYPNHRAFMLFSSLANAVIPSGQPSGLCQHATSPSNRMTGSAIQHVPSTDKAKRHEWIPVYGTACAKADGDFLQLRKS